MQAIREINPAATPEMYVVRFKDKDGNKLTDLSKTPANEFFAMLMLEAEAKGLRAGTVKFQRHVRARTLELVDLPALGHQLTVYLTKHGF